MQLNDVEKVVDYFVTASVEFLKSMGADKAKLPKRAEWIRQLEAELTKTYQLNEFYYLIWLIDNEPVGHSNINNIAFGKTAKMHLHLWEGAKRRSGLGLDFLKLVIPQFFKKFELEKLVCEPKANNPAPNKTLKKLGFELVRTYETTPGWINFDQKVNRYELRREQLEGFRLA